MFDRSLHGIDRIEAYDQPVPLQPHGRQSAAASQGARGGGAKTVMKSIRGNARAKIVPKCSSVAVDPTLYGLNAKTGDAILKQMIIGAESRKKTRGRPLGQLNMGGGLYSPDPSPSNRQLNSPVTGVGFYKSSLKKLERQKYRLPVQNQFRNRIPVFEEAVPEHQFDPAGEPFRLERMRYFQSPRTPFQGDFLLMKPPPAKNIDSFGKRFLPVASAADTSLEYA